MVNLKSCWIDVYIKMYAPPSDLNLINYHETIGTDFHNIYLHISFKWDGQRIPWEDDAIRVLKMRRKIGNFVYYGELRSRYPNNAYNPMLNKSGIRHMNLFKLLGRYYYRYLDVRDNEMMSYYYSPDVEPVLIRKFQLQMVVLENETPSISMYCEEYDCIMDYQLVYSCIPFKNVEIHENVEGNISIYWP